MTRDRGRRRLNFDFLLLNGFSALPQITAPETRRIASRFCREPMSHWRCPSVDDRPVRSGQGVPVEVAGGLAEAGAPTGIVVVIAGNDIGQEFDVRVLRGLGEEPGAWTAQWSAVSARRPSHWRRPGCSLVVRHPCATSCGTHFSKFFPNTDSPGSGTPSMKMCSPVPGCHCNRHNARTHLDACITRSCSACGMRKLWWRAPDAEDDARGRDGHSANSGIVRSGRVSVSRWKHEATA